MDFKILAETILKEVGGNENINEVWNCTTRLRFNLVDQSIVDDKKVQAIPGVLGTQYKNNQYQIIIGNDVAEVYKEIEKLVDPSVPKMEGATKKEKSNPIGVVLEVISGIFTPILPAIIGAGMMKCLLTIFSMTGIVSETSGTYSVLYMISDAAFYFLPFLIAVSASRKFKVNEFIGLSSAGILLYPTLTNGAAEGLEPLKFLNFDVPYLAYSYSVVPIILTIWLMSYVYKFLDKYIPNVLRFILTPVLTLLIVTPISLVILSPLGNYIGNYLAVFLDWLFATAGPVAGFLLAGLNPLLVMTGMHFTIMPIAIQNLALTGYDNFWLPFCLISNVAQAGAIFAVMFKTKNKEGKSVAASTGVSALLGVTEPGMFGVTFKLKKPFYAAMLAGGIGGVIGVLLGVKTYSFSAPNVLILPTYISPDGNMKSLIAIVVAILVSFILSFVFTMGLKFEGLNDDIVETDDTLHQEENTDIVFDKEVVYSPLIGQEVSITEVPDKTFADEIIGKGVAVKPTIGKIYAPFDGELGMVFRTKHAIAFKSTKGVELLVHIGIDTVELDGKGFNLIKEVGGHVNKGDVVMEFDLALIKDSGYSLLTPVVVTNYSDYAVIEKQSLDKEATNDTILMEVR